MYADHKRLPVNVVVGETFNGKDTKSSRKIAVQFPSLCSHCNMASDMWEAADATKKNLAVQWSWMLATISRPSGQSFSGASTSTTAVRNELWPPRGWAATEISFDSEDVHILHRKGKNTTICFQLRGFFYFLFLLQINLK